MATLLTSHKHLQMSTIFCILYVISTNCTQHMTFWHVHYNALLHIVVFIRSYRYFAFESN